MSGSSVDHAKHQLAQAKAQIETALTRVNAGQVSDFELGHIASSARALLDINGVCGGRAFNTSAASNPAARGGGG